MSKHQNPVLVFREEDGDLVLFCEVDGKPIAKRYSGENWVSLEPGWTVRGSEPGGSYNTIEIEYDPGDEDFTMETGKITDGPDRGRWFWRCTCGKCDGDLTGPFKTERAAVKHFKAWVDDIIASKGYVRH